MSQKITLTGVPITHLRIEKNLMGKELNAPKVYSFDMQEGGNVAAVKYLPKESSISFTVFINEKQLRKAGIDENNFKDIKILVQGGLVMDLDMNVCPGEIGVTASQLQVIPSKEVRQDISPSHTAAE